MRGHLHFPLPYSSVSAATNLSPLALLHPALDKLIDTGGCFPPGETLTFRKYLVILAVIIFGSTGDAFLSRGMSRMGPIDVHHLGNVIIALANPFVLTGIVCLLAFMASYMTALSFADLTYVLPATAFGYVNMVAIAHFWLGEHVSLTRWIGVGLIVLGVGVVAGGPARTPDEPPAEKSPAASGAIETPATGERA